MPFSGTLFVLDPASKGEGHCETSGKGLVAEAMSRNIKLNIITGQNLPVVHAEVYNAIRAFPQSVDLLKATHVKIEEFSQLPNAILQYLLALDSIKENISSQDIFWDYYLHTPAQLHAYVIWLKSFSPAERPRIIVNLDWYMDFFTDWINPILSDLKDLSHWLKIASASPTNPSKIQKAIGVRVLHTPRPMAPTKSPSPFDGVIKVGYLGHPSKLKSFDLFPCVVRRCIEETKVNFVFNIREIDYEPECLSAKEELVHLSEMHPNRITIYNGYLAHDLYKQIVSDLSGILVAYDPKSYFDDTPAGTVVEGLLVDTLPLSIEGTSMVKEMNAFGVEIPIIADQSAEAIISSVKYLERHYCRIINDNKAATERWHKFQSYDTLFNKLLVEAWE